MLKKIIIPNGVYHIKGSKTGPRLFLLSGIHGNEVIGIKVIKKIIQDFNLDKLPSGQTYQNNDIQGELFIGYGNIEAIKINKRSTDNNIDLNRVFQPDFIINNQIIKNSSYEIKRAKELLPLLLKTDILIDLHNTYKKSIAFVCLEKNKKQHSLLYNYLDVEHILTDPQNILSSDLNYKSLGTTDYVVNTHTKSSWNKARYNIPNGIGLAYEIGGAEKKQNIKLINKVYNELYNIMYTIKVLSKKNLKKENKKKNNTPKVYSLIFVIKKKYSEKFIFSKKFEKGWCKIKKGDCLGKYINIGKKEISLFEGVVVFQKNHQDMTTGLAMCYIAKKIKKS